MASLPVPINVSFSRASGVVTTWLILTKPQHGKRHIYKDDFSFSLFLPPSFSISEIQELRLGKGKWWGQGSTAGGVSLVAMDIVGIWLFFFFSLGMVKEKSTALSLCQVKRAQQAHGFQNWVSPDIFPERCLGEKIYHGCLRHRWHTCPLSPSPLVSIRVVSKSGQGCILLTHFCSPSRGR